MTASKTTTGKPEKFPLSKPGFQMALVHSVHDLWEDWEVAAPPKNIFLHRPYLTAVEDNPPKDMKFSYVVFYNQHRPVGIAYCQITGFLVDNSVKTSSTKEKYPCIVRAFGRFFKNLVVGKNRNLLVCGNLLLTGEHGFYFDEGIEKSTAFDLVEEAMILTQNVWQEKKVNVDGIFIKDVGEEHRGTGAVLVNRKFREFTFHPNMVLHIREEWNTFEDYMSAISSKYRVRAKKAFRLAEGIERRELTESQIQTYQSRLYELYNEVLDNQDFNMVTLHENYMPALKKELGDRFKIFGYYLKGELVGFFSTIRNGGELEAHFLGFQQDLNREFQIYLNMLFDILKEGISEGLHKVVYARTAMEIKSSVGAEAFQMYCYIRANNSITNKILPPVLEYLRPPDDWLPRNPFK